MSDASLSLAKQEIRTRMRQAVRGLPPSAREAESDRICDQLRAQPFWQDAKRVLMYSPLPDEPDLLPLMRECLAIGRPLSLLRHSAATQAYEARLILDLEADLEKGSFGIWEPRERCLPVDVKHLDLALVPGVAFSANGVRLGRGKGYYDRLLAGTTALKCGVAFDLQVVPDLPFEQHDVRLDIVVTPSRCFTRTRPPIQK